MKVNVKQIKPMNTTSPNIFKPRRQGIFQPRNDWNVRSLNCKGKTAIVTPLDIILNNITYKMNVTIEQAKGKSRKQEVVQCRQMFFKNAKETTNASLAKIGKLVNRDHATVLHGIKTVDNDYELSCLYAKMFNQPMPENPFRKILGLENKAVKVERRAKEPVLIGFDIRGTKKEARPEIGLNDRQTIRPFSGYRVHSM